MSIVISQSKLLQHAGLRMWLYTSYGNTTPELHKFVEMVIWRLVR